MADDASAVAHEHDLDLVAPGVLDVIAQGTVLQESNHHAPQVPPRDTPRVPQVPSTAHAAATHPVTDDTKTYNERKRGRALLGSGNILSESNDFNARLEGAFGTIDGLVMRLKDARTPFANPPLAHHSLAPVRDPIDEQLKKVEHLEKAVIKAEETEDLDSTHLDAMKSILKKEKLIYFSMSTGLTLE